MEETEKIIKIEHLSCPVCGGSGRNISGWVCKNCSGIGSGAFHNGKFFYWGLPINDISIKLRALKHLFHLILSAVAFSFGLLGVLILGFWIWQEGNNASGLDPLSFVIYQNHYLLIFWLSVIADMFVIYRLSQDAESSKKIPKQYYRDKLEGESENPEIPNNWKDLKRYPDKVDVSKGFSAEAIKTVEDALMLSDKLGHSQADVVHLFWSALKNKLVGIIFSRLNVDGQGLVDKIKRQLSALSASAPKEGGKKPVAEELTGRFKEILINSYIYAAYDGQHRVEVANFILHCQEKDENIREILYDMDISRDKIVNAFEWFRINEELVENARTFRKMARYKPNSAMDRAYTALAAPMLSRCSSDLTIKAKWGGLEICVARDTKIEDIFEKFQSGHSGVILVGEPGVGKNTIVGGIAQLMVKEEVPPMMMDKRLVELDIARLVSGADASAVQQRLLEMLDEIGRSGNIVLYIQNIENIVGIQAGGGESLDLSEVLANALEKNCFLCIATTSPAYYSKYVENKALGVAMASVRVEEPDVNQTIQILESKVGYMENKYNVYFSYAALEETVKMTSRYIHDKFLPVKAIEIMESVALGKSKNKKETAVIAKDDIAKAISKATDIPVDKVGEKESKVLLNLEEKIHGRMIGQEEAVKMVAESLRRARAEMRESKRPIANFLFLGPTGVGKTKLAKTVAEVYFGNENSMIRIDMSEYQHQDSVKKMIGDGESLGHLTEAVRQSPFSLVLLDEFEKAHSDILNLFLQVMDDGRLTDGQGRTIDFTNSIIIATSNAGALYIEEEIIKGTDIEQIKQILIGEHLNKVMRPELINRFDGIIVFKPLTEDNVTSIARLMLNKIAKMLESKGVGLESSEEGIKGLARAGFDPKFGARPLRRVLQDKIENIIANKILAGEINRRDTVIINDSGEIEIRKGREL